MFHPYSIFQHGRVHVLQGCLVLLLLKHLFDLYLHEKKKIL